MASKQRQNTDSGTLFRGGSEIKKSGPEGSWARFGPKRFLSRCPGPFWSTFRRGVRNQEIRSGGLLDEIRAQEVQIRGSGCPRGSNLGFRTPRGSTLVFRTTEGAQSQGPEAPVCPRARVYAVEIMHTALSYRKNSSAEREAQTLDN